LHVREPSPCQHRQAVVLGVEETLECAMQSATAV
jgi:hypothetical protein